MKTRILVFMIVGLLVGGATGQPEKEKSDLDKIKGKWVIESIELDGKPLNTNGGISTISDKEWTTKQKDMPNGTATFKLDPSKKPRAIDFAATAGPGKGQIIPGIYLLEGDDLKVCFGLPIEGKEKSKPATRPTEFKSAPAQMLWVLKRQKP